MSSYAVQGNTTALTVGTTVSSYVFQNSITDTFRITSNLGVTNDTIFVAVFAGNVPINMDHPTQNGTTGIGTPVVAGESLYISGGFGLPNPGNVTVAAICSSGTAAVYITPVFTS